MIIVDQLPQIGQQTLHLARHAIGRAGQNPVHLALAEFGAPKPIDAGLVKPRRAGQPAADSAQLPPTFLLDIQCTGKLGQNRLLPVGQPIDQLLGPNDHDPPRVTLADLRKVVLGRCVEGQLRARP